MSLYPEGTSPLPLDDVQRAANKANELIRQELGLNGAEVVTSGSASGLFVALQFINASTITSITAPGITNASALQTSIPAGTIIRGDIRSFTIGATGTPLVVAYKV